MRVLILSWRDLRHPLAGGSEVYSQNLARHWAAAGHEVTFFCAAVAGAPAVEVVDGYRIVRRGSRLGVYRQARRWYRAQEPSSFDVVLDVVNTRPFLSPRWAGDTPVVALIHQVCKEIWRYEVPLPLAVVGRYWLEPRWLSTYRETLTLTVSESSRSSLRDYGLRRVEVVPEGVDAPGSLGAAVAKETSPTVVWVGRMAANKRPADAIEAFRSARPRLGDASLWMIGDGPLRSRLEGTKPEGVRFFGRVDQATKDSLMARAHLLIATSVREGWGLTVSEAAMLGTPALTYDVPGLADSVPAAGGRLCEPTPAAMAEALPAALAQRRVPGDGRGGTQPWAEVAAEVLEHLSEATTTRPSAIRPAMT